VVVIAGLKLEQGMTSKLEIKFFPNLSNYFLELRLQLGDEMWRHDEIRVPSKNRAVKHMDVLNRQCSASIHDQRLQFPLRLFRLCRERHLSTAAPAARGPTLLTKLFTGKKEIAPS
jgi:hypothetical protein